MRLVVSLLVAGPADVPRKAAPALTRPGYRSLARRIDALHQAWSGATAIMLAAPESKSWGFHEFTAADPDGNRLRVFYDFASPEREGSGATDR